ncbi:MAG TPA: maltotransferase domain-containing protein, partial [Casimicrobiaceae bacterium]|nr:maltotransferase domain-containing protein [Casimicrobiaceae bacterium]
MARDPAQREVANGDEEAGSTKRGARTAARRVPAPPDARTALRRVVIENVKPQVDGGRFPIKRTPGEQVTVEADVFTDGHDQIACLLRYRRAGGRAWTEARMAALGNDRWRGEFTVSELGRYEYALAAWIDAFLSWRHDFTRRKVEDEQDIAHALRSGAALVAAAAQRAAARDATQLRAIAKALGAATRLSGRHEIALGEELLALMNAHSDRERETVFEPPLAVVVEPERARYSAWYELFPRSTAKEPNRRGTFADCEAQLPRLAAMGFDVLYLPPIHPIGRVQRKGRNNALVASADDPGSPWAIGSEQGGHKAIHPELGRLRDFKRLVASARKLGIEVALDIALQCAPDHPYVKAHPEWFRRRPDGSIQYAENPPKKYEDIVNPRFYGDAFPALWDALRDVVLFWVDEGVRIFRVDNPHTKPAPFWNWMIGEVKSRNPD